jgi:hypothetical protein
MPSIRPLTERRSYFPRSSSQLRRVTEQATTVGQMRWIWPRTADLKLSIVDAAIYIALASYRYIGEFGEGSAEVVGEVRGEEAEEHVGPDPVFQVVVHGA